MALEAVAARAGTTTPSLRRRYRTKAELALAVVDSLRIQPLPAATGQPRADALAILENLRINMLRRDGMATLGTFLAEEHRNPLLMDHFRRRLIQPRRERLRHALAVGVEDGQLPVGADLDAMASLLVGALYARYLSTGSIPPSWPARTLAIIWPHETSRANG